MISPDYNTAMKKIAIGMCQNCCIHRVGKVNSLTKQHTPDPRLKTGISNVSEV